MRPKSMILILIALGCGLIASIGISQVVERKLGQDGGEVETRPIYVAISEIGIGEELGPQTIKLEEWPVDKIPEGAISDAAVLEEKSPSQRLYAGEPILMAKIADRSSLGSYSQTIKSGMRVFSVKVDMASAISGLAKQGDRVDVLALVDDRAETILENIEVFAINEKVTRELSADGTAIQAKTISLLVTPDQAKTLMPHSSRGIVMLTLRSQDDSEEVAAAPRPTPVPEPVPEPALPIFATSPFEAPPTGNEFVMEIMEGGASNVRRFRWDDRESLPRELTNEDNNANAAPEMEFPFPTAGDLPPDEVPQPVGVVQDEN